MTQESVLRLINQLHQLSQKISKLEEDPGMARLCNRMASTFAEEGYVIESPLGMVYDPTRTDLEVSFEGIGAEKPLIIEVVKPVVYVIEAGRPVLLQRGVVIVGGNL
ncbi:MAG: hypothetical protein NWR72_06060 [Bacteroidia bacterium]|nr:hypothetical protein [Bacteroidia bacterium]